MPLRYTEDGYPFYEGVDLDAEAAREAAAIRVARGVKSEKRLPVEVEAPARPSYIMEPDLLESQGGMKLPAGLMQDDSGRLFYQDAPDVTVPMVKRPSVIPIAKTPEGLTFAMPKMLDALGNVGSPLAAGRVPVKAGEVVLGSGAMRTVNETAKETGPFYSALETAVSNAKLSKGDATQWMGYLKNQPGVKAEELNYVLSELPAGSIAKADLENLVKQNKAKLDEKILGGGGRQEAKIKVEEAGEALKNAIGNKQIIATSPEGKEISLYGDEVARAISNKMLPINSLPKEYQQLAENLNKAWDAQVEAGKNAATKYHSYQLPGGENYKEMLLSLPVKTSPKAQEAFDITKRMSDGEFNSLNETERRAIFKKRDELLKAAKAEEGLTYKSSHWDEPNVLAHIRMNDRNVEGKKTLHLEEIQSDWHQAGRKHGYKLSEKQKAELESIDEKLMKGLDEKDIGNPDIDAVLKTAVDKKVLTADEAKNYKDYSKGENSNVPDAPFKKNWDELALKRMLHKAANEGYEGISWTPGEAQAARYDLSKQVKSIHWGQSPADKQATLVQIHPQGGGTDPVLKLQVDKNGKVVASFPSSRTNQFEGKLLSDVIGKEHAEKILDAQKGSLEGEGLKIGGEGMKSFYDKMLVDRANNLAKKHGSKVETKQINVTGGKSLNSKDHGPDGPFPDGIGSIHYLPITPELRAKAKEGFPLFSSTPIQVPVDHNPFTDKDKKVKLTPVSGNPFQ